LGETQYPSGVLCYCDEKLAFEPIEEVEVVPKYTNKSRPKREHKNNSVKANPVRDERKQNNCNSEVEQEVVSALIKLGFSKSEAKNLVETNSSGEGLSSEELFERVLEGVS